MSVAVESLFNITAIPLCYAVQLDLRAIDDLWIKIMEFEYFLP